jgi:Uma2 family endonuclease
MGTLARKFFTPTEYLRLEETAETKHEYRDGLIVPMVGGSFNHSVIIANVQGIFNHLLSRKPCHVLSEVLFNTTRTYERGRKFDPYRTLKSLHAYVLIDQDEAHVEYFRKLSDGAWKLEEYRQLHDRLKLHALDIAVSLADVYRKVEWAQPGKVAKSKKRRT